MKTSSKKLSATKSHSLWDNLVIILSDTKNQSEMSDFLDQFLTNSEKTALSKRLGILLLLYSNYSYEEIQSELQVSSATVSAIAKMKDLSATEQAVEKLAVHNWADKLASQVLSWFKHS